MRNPRAAEVATYQLSGDARDVVINARSRKEYAPLVRENTIFSERGWSGRSF